jgi:hypothetical protein
MARGYSNAGDIVARTVDGFDLEEMFREFQETLAIVNEEREAVSNFLSFRTVRSADGVAQTVDDDGFELASEFGEPKSIAARPDIITMGYTRADWDLATRFTARYLRDATAAEIQSVHSRAIAADNKLVHTAILARLLNPTPGENEDGKTVYGLWNGTDSMIPPRYAFRTFTSNHTHYLTTGSANADGADLDALIATITEHGYGTAAGSQLVLFLNHDELPQVEAIRAGASGATRDYIPGVGADAYLTDQTLVGSRAPEAIGKLRVAGAYGPVWVVPTDFMPPDYLLAVATDGPNSSLNPVGFRQHPNPAHQGLRLLPGNQREYPLSESFYTRCFGVGVRHRGAAAVMQITTNSSYTPPTL